ncbi:MAG: Omp28-related outer membrane protein, partial [Bacteroidales bacterium]|nr:Omp28-related outer membrane protein [Bacteroidales bacterium]
CNDNQVCIPVVVRQAGAQTQDEEDMSWVDKEFYHRSLAMRFTADWCGYCPTVAANMAEFERLYPNKVEMVHMHCDGNLKFSGAGPLENLCNITGFPTGIFDMRGEFYSTSSIKEQLDKTEQNYSTQTGVSYMSSLSGSNLTIDLKVYAKEADKYKVTVLLLEDNIVGYQADYYNGTQYDYVHRGVVRMALTNVLGDDCTTTQNNQIVKKSYSVNIPSKYKKENMRILVYVQRPYGSQSIIDGKYYGNYYVDNSISGKLGAEFKLEMIEDLSGGGNEDIIPDDDIDF